jgi:hypothetical protein
MPSKGLTPVKSRVTKRQSDAISNSHRELEVIQENVRSKRDQM